MKRAHEDDGDTSDAETFDGTYGLCRAVKRLHTSSPVPSSENVAHNWQEQRAPDGLPEQWPLGVGGIPQHISRSAMAHQLVADPAKLAALRQCQASANADAAAAAAAAEARLRQASEAGVAAHRQSGEVAEGRGAVGGGDDDDPVGGIGGRAGVSNAAYREVNRLLGNMNFERCSRGTWEGGAKGVG